MARIKKTSCTSCGKCCHTGCGQYCRKCFDALNQFIKRFG